MGKMENNFNPLNFKEIMSIFNEQMLLDGHPILEGSQIDYHEGFMDALKICLGLKNYPKDTFDA